MDHYVTSRNVAPARLQYVTRTRFEIRNENENAPWTKLATFIVSFVCCHLSSIFFQRCNHVSDHTLSTFDWLSYRCVLNHLEIINKNFHPPLIFCIKLERTKISVKCCPKSFCCIRQLMSGP